MIGVAALVFAAVLEAQQPRRLTVLYDAFGAPSNLERDWGFAALVEYVQERFDAAGVGAVIRIP